MQPSIQLTLTKIIRTELCTMFHTLNSENPKFMFLDKSAIPMSNITFIKDTVYDKEFKRIFKTLPDVDLGENIIFIQRRDGWYHWIKKKTQPAFYSSLSEFIRTGGQKQFDLVPSTNAESEKAEVEKKSNNQLMEEPKTEMSEGEAKWHELTMKRKMVEQAQ